mgnify:CR=1 FL=1
MPFSLHGIPVSNGIAIGRALTISSAALEVGHHFINDGEEDAEVPLLLEACPGIPICNGQVISLEGSVP